MSFLLTIEGNAIKYGEGTIEVGEKDFEKKLQKIAHRTNKTGKITGQQVLEG